MPPKRSGRPISGALRVIGAEELRRALPMEAAIDALEVAFATREQVSAPPRSHVELSDGTLLLMPATGPAGTGVKLVTVNPSNPDRGLPFIHALYVLFRSGTLEPEAVIDGGALTGLRTAAVSGLATRHLARPDARRLVIFGAGVQANSHLDAMVAVRPIAEVTIVSRTRDRAERLAERAARAGLHADVGGPDAVSRADIVCTCTTSDQPLFDGADLRAGAHVNAVGAFRPDARELDDSTVGRARIIVEERAAALAEAGDVLIPLRSHVIAEADIVDLSEVVGGARVRAGDDDVTVFKSVGLAFEDLAVAAAIVARIEP